LIERLPGGYDYPLLSFNAFATKAKEEMGIESSIIIGEGYFTFQEAVGLASEGPEYALTRSTPIIYTLLLIMVKSTRQVNIMKEETNWPLIH